MAKAREIPGIEAELSFREAAARAVEVRAEELFSFGEGVLDTTDAERVHDMRVASRRLRGAMEVFEPCFAKHEHKSALRDVKRLADALGERRDPDVAIAALERVAAALSGPDRPGVASLVEELCARQEGGNERLADELERMDAAGFRERLLALSATARAPELHA